MQPTPQSLLAIQNGDPNKPLLGSQGFLHAPILNEKVLLTMLGLESREIFLSSDPLGGIVFASEIRHHLGMSYAFLNFFSLILLQVNVLLMQSEYNNQKELALPKYYQVKVLPFFFLLKGLVPNGVQVIILP